MNFNYYLTVIFLVLFSASAFSQDSNPGEKALKDSLDRRDSVHIKDSIRLAKKVADSIHFANTAHYHYSYAGTGTVNHTNTIDSYVFNNSLSGSVSKKSATFSISNNWIYGWQNGNLTNNDFNSTADVNLYKTLKHFYYWGLVTYNTSLSLQVNHLIQSGFGAGYSIVDKKIASLSLSDGILYEKGDLYDILYGSPNGDVPQRDRYQVLRNSLRIKYRFIIHDRVTFEGADYIQNSLTHFNNYILKINGSVSIKLYKWLSLTAALDYNKFTRTRSENTLMTFGLTIRQ